MTNNLFHISIPFIPHDKFLHFIVSFGLVVIIFLIRKYYIKDAGFIRIFAYSFRDVLIIGIFKETLDLLWYGNPELWDIVANISGIIAPVYIFFIINLSSQLKRSKKIIYETTYIIKFKNEKNTFKKMKILSILISIWAINTLYLCLKIPLLALKGTYNFIRYWLTMTFKEWK